MQIIGGLPTGAVQGGVRMFFRRANAVAICAIRASSTISTAGLGQSMQAAEQLPIVGSGEGGTPTGRRGDGRAIGRCRLL